ncbi:conserved hypothetical protein [Xanthomonas citri pv. fuscans]|nr:conserved hypothetical protein [Xanthomonas citri pv. fuscans]SOO01411.1 conserved hypothetical protein [Xanthomonas citri pv. fuscans]SOO13951.1 conserved hypothetical protein [Xanthomonas citri pv. fuscans]SOO45031.1 conserved hypothetical protein [Xanthomonas citri pv. fuscans]
MGHALMLRQRASGRRAQLRAASSSEGNNAVWLEACHAVAVQAPCDVHALQLTRRCHAQA